MAVSDNINKTLKFILKFFACYNNIKPQNVKLKKTIYKYRCFVIETNFLL